MVRLKHRYLLLQILYPDSQAALPGSLAFHAPTADTLTTSALARLIRDAVAEQFGDYGAGLTSTSLSVKYFSAPTSTAIVRVSRAHYRLAWAACTAITSLPERGRESRECVVRVVRVSGTIKHAELEVIKRAKEAIASARRAGVERPKALKERPPVVVDDESDDSMSDGD